MRLADRYRVLRRVGEGGGGGVWLVEDRLADDAVMVLKRLHAHAQASLAQWLVNEFQILAQLDLPTVARVYDFGLAQPDAEDPGGTFFTREFVDGTPLDEALTPLHPSRVRALFVSAAETLRELHRLGVVHGDLKPANLIVPRDSDRVALIDFGLAQGALGAAAKVRGGTLGFMPPERQAQLLAGEALSPDPRADVYALCMTLRAVLAGTVTPGHDPTVPPAVEGVPALRALWEIATRGAAEDPARRFGTVDDLLVALGETGAASLQGRVVLRPEGREHELGILLDALARRLVRREAGVPVVLLRGDEGSGRSTLLRELAWRAQLRGVQTLGLQCAPGDGPARRLREAAEILSGTTVDRDAPDALATAFRKAAATAPVLVLADDLDRADPGVAALLRSLAYGCEAHEPLLVIATATDESRVKGLDPALRVSLGPLDEQAVASLCAQILGAVEPAVIASVHRRTGGSPLAVTEVLLALSREAGVTPADVDRVEIPTRARDVALRRVGALPPPARDAAAVIAAFDGEATAELLRPLVPAWSAVEAARAAGVVTVRPDGRWSITHAALEPALFASLDADARVAMLRDVAGALDRAAESVGEDPRDAPSASSRARLWLRAGDVARARPHVAEAVASLRREGLPLAAVQLLAAVRAAAPESVSPEAVYEEAELLHEGGELAEADALAATVSEREGPCGQRATLLRARLRRLSGDLAEAERLAVQVADAARGHDPALFAEALLEATRVSMLHGDYATVRARCDEVIAASDAPSTRASARGLGGLAALYASDTTRGMAMLEDARGEFASLSLPREEATLFAYLAIGRERSGDLAGARSLHEQALDRARSAGDLRTMVTCRINLGHIAQRMGDLGAAIEHNQAALKLAQRAGLRSAGLHARINTASQLIRVGSLDRARAELDAVQEQGRETGHRDLVAAATLMLGVTRARTGDVDAGLGLIAEAEGQFLALGQSDDAADALLDACEVVLDRGAGGDLDRGAEKLARAREVGGDLGLRASRARMLEGRVMLARGDARGAARVLGEAITEAEAQRDWEVLAQSLAARAMVHATTGAELHARRDRERAVEVLEEKAALLPPDLRSAFWSVSRRASLRSETSSMSPAASEMVAEARGRRGSTAMPGPRGANGNVNAPTLIANDERLVLLLELSKRLGEEHSLDRVLDQAVQSAVELTNGERGAVLLDEGGKLEIRVRHGVHRGDGPDDQVSRSIAETVWIDGEPVVTLNAQGDRRFADFRSVHELGVCAVAAVPIRVRGRTLGVLYVESRRRRVAWAASDIALMEAFGEQAGIAVEHARLVEELEARSRDLEAARQELTMLLETRTHELETTRNSLVRAQEALSRRFTPGGLVAHTEAMRKVFALIERVRDSDVSVVIEGESGTGKELVARALHFSGSRAKGPFVVVHCGAIPETLLESELFGHVKGAFTGADKDRRGLIASAHGGTLMLDEVSEMPPRMQVELLRVLQDRRLRPVGSDRDEVVDVRVVAASNRALTDLVAEGRFREDLYYRLSVVSIRIPPLRERLEDIPALAAHFLTAFCEEHGGARRRLSRDALQRLVRYAWPGNVRQLRHALESAAVLSEGDVIEADALPLPSDSHDASSVPPRPSTPAPGPAGVSSSALRKASERQRIVDALEQVNWNKVRAAQVLGMPRRTLYRRLREYGLLD